MKFGILTQYYPPEIGAPQRRLSRLAQRMAKQGHEIHVLTAMPNYPAGKVFPGYGGLWRREQLDGVDVLRAAIYPSKSVSLVPRLANYFSFVASSAVVGAAMLPRLDYLMTESPPLFLGISGWLLHKACGARWIFNVSDLWPESAVRLGVVGDGPALRVAYGLEARCYRSAWLVTAQSREIAASVETRFPGVPTYHLPNGVDSSVFTPENRDQKTREWLGARSNKDCVAVYAGLHGIAQGLDQVLRAADRLRGVAGLSIVFIGDGPEKRRLREMAASMQLGNVRFEEAVEGERMPAIMASADISIIPLKGALPGAVPSKVYEAMASGAAVMMVADGEPAAIVRGSGAGLVSGFDDPEALASGLRRLASDHALRRTLGDGGRKAAAETYDYRMSADRFIRHLEENTRSA